MARRPHARILADFCQVQKILVTKKQMLARQRLSAQLSLHHGRIFRQRFFAQKKKWGWMPNAQIALSVSKIAAARRKEREWHLGTFRTISQR